jgi:hypothetical protein
MKPLRPKRCRACRQMFTPFRPLQRVCSTECAHQLVIINREKSQKKETKVALEKFKTVHDYRKAARIPFHKWVREVKGKGHPCISCGTYQCEEFHAGHFINSTCKELEFEPDNVWKQCSQCNTHLRGNLIPYQDNLIALIGLERVEWLKVKREPQKYDREHYKALAALYKRLLKEAA